MTTINAVSPSEYDRHRLYLDLNESPSRRHRWRRAASIKIGSAEIYDEAVDHHAWQDRASTRQLVALDRQSAKRRPGPTTLVGR